MKKSKSTILLLLTSIIVFPMLIGCFGVGEDDPFISLRSRKARLTGQWEISQYYKNVKLIQDTVARLRVITDVQGTDYEETTFWLGTDSTAEVDGEVLQSKMTFDKNGYFTYLFEYTTEKEKVDQATFTSTTTTKTFKQEMDGTWNFLGGIDEYSNKERISLVVLNEKNSVETVKSVTDEETGESDVTTSRDYIIQQYANGEMSYIWELNMLKNSEVHLYQDINNVSVSTDTAASGAAFDEVGYQQRVLKSKDNNNDE